jgi:chromosome segregation ATPase
MGNVWAVLAACAGGGGLAGVIGTLITGMLTRPKTRADAVASLTGAAIQQVNELQERTAEAEREAKAARDELASARKQVRALAEEIDAAVATLRTWRSTILTPGIEIEQLRAMVRDPGGTINGRHL